MDRTFLAVILLTLVLLVVAGSVIAARGKPDKPPKPRGDGDPPAELVLTLAVSDVAASAPCSGTLHAEWNVDGAKGGKIKFELREYDGTWSVAHAGRTTNDGYEEWTLTDRPVGSDTYVVRFQSGKSWVFSNMVTGLSCD